MTDDLRDAIRKISIALSASHNCIATDVVDAVEDDTHWRIDNTDALAELDRIERALVTVTTDARQDAP